MPASPASTDTMSVASGSESEEGSLAPSQVPKLKRTHRMGVQGQSSSHQSQAQSLSKSSNQLESFKFPISKRILEYSKMTTSRRRRQKAID